jgi:exopolysaccharide biosynthesis polyprenyl glycosylphosphotransferase
LFDLATIVAVAVVLHAVCFVHCRMYLSRFISRGLDEMRRLISAATAATVGITSFAFVIKVELSRVWVGTSFALVCFVVGCERLVVRASFRRLRQNGYFMRPVVLVGSNGEGLALRDMFVADASLGYRLAAHVDDVAFGVSGRDATEDIVRRTHEALRATHATSVVLATSALFLASTNRLVRELTEASVHVELSSTLLDIATNRLTVRPLGRFPVVYVEPIKRDGWRAIAKRSFDIIFAAVVLIVTAPVLLVASIAIKMTSPGPVIFRQERVGRDGRTFKLFKLRTMVNDAESRLEEIRHLNEVDGPLFKLRADPRITRVGRLLRKSSLDELPQLINVLRNNMSVVGPRPALPSEAFMWDPEFRNRLRVRPGITGMWQVNGRSDTSFEMYQRLDLYYVENWSLVTDMVIVLRTIPTVLWGKGAR